MHLTLAAVLIGVRTTYFDLLRHWSLQQCKHDSK
jgi:hypothetical protein